jgi:hypothetical protein
MKTTKITSTASMRIDHDLTAADLLQFVQSVPAEAKVSVRVDRGGGNQLDPGSTTITATWDGSTAKLQGFQLPHSHIPGARG